MGVSIDKNNVHSLRRFGDVLQALTWINDERAMVIMHATKPDRAWFCVLESASFKYDDDKYLAAQGKKCAEILGLEYNVGSWFKIATIIHDGLPDLIRMPTAPEREFKKHGFGDMTLKGDGQIIKQEEMREEKGVIEYE